MFYQKLDKGFSSQLERFYNETNIEKIQKILSWKDFTSKQSEGSFQPNGISLGDVFLNGMDPPRAWAMNWATFMSSFRYPIGLLLLKDI